MLYSSPFSIDKIEAINLKNNLTFDENLIIRRF